MYSSYWSNTLSTRLSRRRALKGMGTLSAGALAATLLSCGSNGDDNNGSSGLVSKPVDTTKQAVKGGTMQSFQAAEGLHFDPSNGTSLVIAHTVHAYSRLFRYKVGTVFEPPDGSVEGDAASSWEISPDGLTLTMKLRPNMKFDQRAPTNGRVATVEDMKYSFDRFSRIHPNRANILNSLAPDSPVLSFTTPDSSTMVMKLAFPMGAILRQFAYAFLLYLTPVESEDKFDLKQEMRGTGPWLMNKFTPSVGWEYQRNPNWFNASERPYLDGINYALLSEAATRVAQFQAKRLWTYPPTGDQVLPIKREAPGAVLTALSPLAGNGNGVTMAFSKLPNTPFKDQRLRQAVSMLFDRDAWIDAFFNVTQLQAEGLPMETGWHSHVPCSWPTVWLDPKAGKVGEGSKYFQHNPDEAAKLLRAAGKFGMETEFSWPTSSGGLSTEEGQKQRDVFVQMLQAGGHYKVKLNGGHYGNWYQPEYLRKRAQVEGMYYVPGGGGPDMDLALWGRWAPGSGDDFIYDWANVPGLEDIMKRHRRELDDKKRVAINHEFQKEMAKQMPVVLFPGQATAFNFHWPWLGNGALYQAWQITSHPAEATIHNWYDKSKDTRSS